MQNEKHSCSGPNFVNFEQFQVHNLVFVNRLWVCDCKLQTVDIYPSISKCDSSAVF